MKKKELHDAHLQVRVPHKKIETYKAMARRDGRSLSNWVENTLDRAVIAAVLNDREEDAS